MAFNQGICVKIHQTKSNQNGRQSGEGRIYIKIHQTKLNQYGRQSDIQNNLDNHSVVVYIL